MDCSQPETEDEAVNVLAGRGEQRTEVLRSRVGLLKGKDRYLMQLYLENAATFRQMALVSGINEANVARRIHKLVRRLLDGQYIACLRASAGLTEAEKEIAKEYLVEGTSMGKIAEKNGTSYYAVRQLIKRIQNTTHIETRDNQSWRKTSL